MASSPVKFLFALLVFAALGWVVFVFAARLLTWFLSRVLKACVEFRVAGCNCLRDVSIKFQKGAVESISIGEIKLSLRKSLVNLGFSFISGDPKLQLLICDLDVVLRPSEKSIIKRKPQKSRPSGRGKWTLLTNIGRFISVSIIDFVVKAPKVAVEIKDLGVEISKNSGPNPVLYVNLCLNPLHVQLCDPCALDQGDSFLGGQSSLEITEKDSVPFLIENLMIACVFGHDREQGIKIKNMDLTSGDITVNLNETHLLQTKKKSEANVVSGAMGPTLEATVASKSQNNKLSSLMRKPIVPEKVSFNLPRLNVKFTHLGRGLSFENNVMGIQLRYSKCISYEDSGENATRFDVKLDFSEIHLLKEGNQSVLEILKVVVIGSIDVPNQPVQSVRAEIDVKLGGTQCNLVISRWKPLLELHFSRKKSMIVHEKKSNEGSSQTSNAKTVMWTCTLSAPEMTVVLYGFNDLPLYNVCSQSTHLFANNIARKGIQIHAEFGELQWHMADNYQESLQENLFSLETNSGSLMHISRVSLDWGYQAVESYEAHDPNKSKLSLVVDVTGMAVYFDFHQVESLIFTLMCFKALLKNLPGSKKRHSQIKAGPSRTNTSKGTQIIKINFEKCSINYCGDVTIEEMIVPDPKRVNYGSQGGECVISISADGTPRTASIMPTSSGDYRKLKFSTSLNISQLNLNMNKEKKSLQLDLQRAKSIYMEYAEDNKPGTKVTVMDLQNAKFVRRSGGLNDISVCSLINVTDIAVRWEPDFHLAIFELITLLKSTINNKNNELFVTGTLEGFPNLDREPEKEIMYEHAQFDKQSKKKESIFAIDLEKLKVTAELADGVKAVVNVQSIFSENARIGVLLEELMMSFNDARILESSRMQISRIPVSISNNIAETKVQPTTTWDWVVQGPDVHICMPYRLQLRAIDDAVEDTLRGLKLIATAKTNLIYPSKSKSKKLMSKSSKFGSFRFVIRKLTAEIEEEPLQGWLDEHYSMMKSEVCELGVRLKFLEELLSADTNELSSGKKCFHDGKEINLSDTEAIKYLKDEIHKQAFRSYYKACQSLVLSEGSGACRSGFQSGFAPSAKRTSLLTISATELDFTLMKIEGGNTRMVEFINKVDPVSLDEEIPFSRMYGRDVSVNVGSLTVQLRDYTYPLFSATSGKCQGRVVLAQQATFFQPQIQQDVYIGKWWKVRMLRSASGTSPPIKTYTDLPLHFNKVQLSYGVGYEPAFADISYAFTVALRRAVLGTRGNNPMANQPPKKERSLPWWDDMRNYIHGKISMYFNESTWNLLATTDPYEKSDKLKIITNCMEILQSDGHVTLSAKDFTAYLSSIENLLKNCSLKLPNNDINFFLHAPALTIDVTMGWECESGRPLNHYLHALPKEGKTRDKVLDPFRSTSLSLRWNILLRPSLPTSDEPISVQESHVLESTTTNSPTLNFGAHDLVWLFKWWNMVYIPPQKLRSFSRWPRFGIPRAVRSGNLSLDKVMTEFFLRVDSTPTCIKHAPLGDDDPASGLTFKMAKLKFERCYSRGKQKFTFESKRDPLDLVYQGVDLHQLKAYLIRTEETSVALDTHTSKTSRTSVDKLNTEKCLDDGFLLESDYFTIRRQAPKADAAKILAWQEAGRKNLEMTYVRYEIENGSESDHARSDLSDDDDGFSVVMSDNCQSVFVYGLKLLWTIENRDAVWSWVGGISKAFGPSKPSPSRQYAQRKLLEQQQTTRGGGASLETTVKIPSSSLHGANSPSPQHAEPLATHSLRSPPTKYEGMCNVIVDPGEIADSEEDGTRHFMVNVIQPQFNLHSEDANGRFLLAAATGRVLARSFHSILHVGSEMLEQALGNISIPDVEPEMTWKRVELSVMLEQVQAHVAPTDVDPGAGLQWLPKILKSSPKVKRTGALLERVFMPCQMYFRYTRHKGGTPELKVKPLKELKFNSPNITATMTSRQFQVMLDVLTNLLFARLPKPRKSSLTYPTDDEDVEEEADEVVPDGVEEVELARISVEHRERERKLILDDIRTLSGGNEILTETVGLQNDRELWMITGGKLKLVSNLEKDLSNVNASRKGACSALRTALQKAAQLRLMEKEKNKSPSYAMRISLRINMVVWSMLADGKSFAEAELNDMIYDFDRDYKDIGVAVFTTKSCVLRNCLQNAKSATLLSAWNPPSDWEKNVMIRVHAKQGAPKDGNSLLESFQVDIYPLKIHLTETMYRMMWEYFFPEEEQDSQRRQEVWKVSTTAGARRVRKSTSGTEITASTSQAANESDIPKKIGSNSLAAGSSNHGDLSEVTKLMNSKLNNGSGSHSELRRTSSFDRTWEETLAEYVPNELVLQNLSTKNGPLGSEYQYAIGEDTSKNNKVKDSKPVRLGRLSHEEKKVVKVPDDKRTRTRKLMEFHNIRISQVELLVTYESSRFAVNDLRLLMDSFYREDFTGTWRRLFSRVKKHIIWGVLKSVTGMQGKKFKDKAQSQKEPHGIIIPETVLDLSDSDGGHPGKSDFPLTRNKRTDGAGEGFVTSVKGLFNSQRRKAKALLRTMRGEADNELPGEWSGSDGEYHPFARQLTITKAKKLIRRHTNKLRSRAQRSSGASMQQESLPSSPRENSPFPSDTSGGSSSYEDFNE